jgi:hypothetical protein
MPHLLSERQKVNCITMCHDLQGRVEREPEYPSKIITDGETWVYMYKYNPEMKQQSPQWKSQSSPPWKKARQVC